MGEKEDLNGKDVDKNDHTVDRRKHYVQMAGQEVLAPADITNLSDWKKAVQMISLEDFKLNNILSIPCIRSSFLTGTVIGTATYTINCVIRGKFIYWCSKLLHIRFNNQTFC